MKLETSIRELHEMFMDMAMFVETQVTRPPPNRAQLWRGLGSSLRIQELMLS